MYEIPSATLVTHVTSVIPILLRTSFTSIYFISLSSKITTLISIKKMPIIQPGG